MMNSKTILAPIAAYCHALEEEFDMIPATRKVKLTMLSRYISQKHTEKKTAEIVVICTHNSRRSHLGQIWLAVGADYYGISEISTYSGGTEVTALNNRVVEALERIGFGISIQEKIDNPRYQISWTEDQNPYIAYSKHYESPPNPRRNFAAVMVCIGADQGCPIVHGCDFRLSLPFHDPKASDDTPQESTTYDDRVRQIGREMLYILSKV